MQEQKAEPYQEIFAGNLTEQEMLLICLIICAYELTTQGLMNYNYSIKST